MKTKLILKILDEMVPEPRIPLEYSDPFTLLIAVILSAQTTDERVNKVTKDLFKRANTAQKMASLSLKEIEDLIRSCGLYKRKAKAIKSVSEEIVKKYKGKVPSTLKKLESLKGVGHKSASVVALIAFNRYTFPVDTHILRASKRWKLSNKNKPIDVENDLKRIFPKKKWKKVHLQIILYCRKYCKARGHQIEKCPICNALNKKAIKSS